MSPLFLTWIMLLVAIGVTIVIDVSLIYFTWEEAFGLKFSVISGVITLRNSPRIQPYYILSVITLTNQFFIFYVVNHLIIINYHCTILPRSLSLAGILPRYLTLESNTHTHTHTHIHIYIYIQIHL